MIAYEESKESFLYSVDHYLLLLSHMKLDPLSPAIACLNVVFQLGIQVCSSSMQKTRMHGYAL